MSTIISQTAEIATPVDAAFRVDPSRGTRDGAVNRQWATRPDDQRFLSIAALRHSVAARSHRSHERSYYTLDLHFSANRENPNRLEVVTPGDRPIRPTHWSFGQLARLAGAPADYMRKLPAYLAAVNMQYGLSSRANEPELVKFYEDDGHGELRAATSAEYGRILDRDVVDSVATIAGDGTGDTDWKVPGLLNWSTGHYNPFVDVTKQTTTLYASDRDVWMFLVDDRRPFSIGKLPNGDDDLVFRGFYVWNSEVGAASAGLATFLLRGVCANRNLWGVEQFAALRIRHTKHAATRFDREARPALERYATSSPGPFVAGINAARAAIVARDDDERRAFLAPLGFSRPMIGKVLDAVAAEEGHPASSVWDFVQGITAVARTITHNDQRVDLERRAGTMLTRAAARAA